MPSATSVQKTPAQRRRAAPQASRERRAAQRCTGLGMGGARPSAPPTRPRTHILRPVQLGDAAPAGVLPARCFALRHVRPPRQRDGGGTCGRGGRGGAGRWVAKKRAATTAHSRCLSLHTCSSVQRAAAGSAFHAPSSEQAHRLGLLIYDPQVIRGKFALEQPPSKQQTHQTKCRGGKDCAAGYPSPLRPARPHFTRLWAARPSPGSSTG